MKITQVKDVLEIAYEIKRPVFLHSMPGLGKSTVIREWAESKNMEFMDLRVSQKSPTEIGPVLFVEKGKSDFTVPTWIPTTGKGILLLDEISDAPLMVQSACYELVLDRKLGKAKLGSGWLVVLAGNRQQDKAASGRLSTALSNRCIHIEIEPDAESLKQYAYRNNWNDVIPGILTHRPDLISTFDSKSKDFAFASPRTWEYVSDILNQNPDVSVRYDILAGTIGAGAASELEGFLRIRDELPNLQRIIKHPETEKIPESPAGKWAVCGALANLANQKNLGKLLIYVDRMEDDNKSVFIRDILLKDNSLMNNKDYIKWIVKNQEIYLDDLF